MDEEDDQDYDDYDDVEEWYEEEDDDYDPESNMNTAEYANCCGIRVIYGFDDTSDPGIKRIKSYIDRKIKERGCGIYQCALNEYQRPTFHKILVDEFGFTEVVSNFFNPNSGNLVSLYTKVVVGDNFHYTMAKKTNESIFQKQV